MPNLTPMHGIDLERLEKLAEGLALLFYIFMFMALVTALAGSAGSGFLLLTLGSCAHVGRASLEEFVERERGRGYRPTPEPRAKADREIERTRRARRVVA